MSIITFEEAVDQLNLTEIESISELELFVAAANDWITERVTDTSPYPIKLAALFLVEHWWESQRGPASTPANRLGRDDMMISGTGYAIPNRVLELLGPYIASTAPQGSFPTARAHPDPIEF